MIIFTWLFARRNVVVVIVLLLTGQHVHLVQVKWVRAEGSASFVLVLVKGHAHRVVLFGPEGALGLRLEGHHPLLRRTGYCRCHHVARHIHLYHIVMVQPKILRMELYLVYVLALEVLRHQFLR